MPKTRTSRFNPMVMTAAGENPRRERKVESTRPHRRSHRSKDADERTRSKSSGSRGRGENNDEGEHRRKRKSGSRKRDRDDSRRRKEKSETTVAGSTYELSGALSRSFDFVISPVPVTRGALPRPELTRSSEAQLGSSMWLVDRNSSDSSQAVAPGVKSSLRKPFAPSRKDEKREVNVISASSQLSNKKSKRSSKRSYKKKKTSGAEKETEKEEPNELPTDGAMSPPSGQGSGATSPQQRSEPRLKPKSRSKSKRKSREDKESEADKDGEKSPNDNGKRKKSKRTSREHKDDGEESPTEKERKSKRKSREDKGTKADKDAGEESPKERQEPKSGKDKETKADKGAEEESPKERKERKSTRKSREDKEAKADKGAEEESPKEGKARKSKRKSKEDKETKAEKGTDEESPKEGKERKSKRKYRKDKATKADKSRGEASPQERKERRSKRKPRKEETEADKSPGEENPKEREERKSKRRTRDNKGKESPGHSGNTSPQEGGERKKRGRHVKNDRDRKHRRHRKKYSPKGAPENGTTNSYFFQWDTGDVPSVAGVHRDLIFSTRQMEGESPIGSPGTETDTLPFSSFSTSTLPDKKRRPDSGRTGNKSDQRATSRRSGRPSKRSKHDRHHRSRRGHGRHRSRKGREEATSPRSPPSGKITPAESRSPPSLTSPAGPGSPAGHVSPASPSGMISPDGLKSPSSQSPTSQESSLSPESSRKKSPHHRHGKKHRRDKKHKRRGSPRDKSRSRASKRSRSKHRRSKSSRSERETDRSPRKAESSSVSPESTVSGGSKRQKGSRSHSGRSRTRSGSHRSGRSSRGSKNRSKRRSLSSERSRERSRKSSSRDRNTETSTKSRDASREDKIRRKRSRTRTKSRSRHSSRSRSSRKSRSRSQKSNSRSTSRSGGSRRSRSKRGRESESVSRSSPYRTSSATRKHRGKKRHHRRRHRKGHDRSPHRKSRSLTTRKKQGDAVTESYAAQSAPAYLCLLLSSLAATLTMVTCVMMVYYVITCKKQLGATIHAVPSGTTQHKYPEPWHEPIGPEVVPGTPKAIQVYYCTTDHCKREARYIGRLLSQQERPCDNFYKHVCNVWMSEHPAHALSSGSVVSRDTLLQDNIARQLVAVVSSANQRDVQVAANLYKACADRSRSAGTSKEAIGALFSQWKIEKWPRNAAVEDIRAVWTFAAELSRDLNLATLVRAGVGTDPDNVDVTAIELSQPRCLYTRVGKDNKEAEDLFIAAVREAAAEIGDSGVAADALGGQMWSACTLIAAACRSGYGDDRVTVVKFGQLKHLGLQTFLTVLLDGGIGGADNVVLHSVHNFLRELQGALQTVPPLDALNYLGFLAIVHVAPFLPDELRGLRYLFTEVRLGRMVGDAKDDTPLLCARLVERALPGCFAKAAHMWRLSNGQEMSTREWLSQLESVFLRHVADFPWMSELSSLLIRYRVKRRALTQFGQSLGERRDFRRDGACAPLDERLDAEYPLLFFANVSRRRQAQKFRELRGDSALLRRSVAGSEFSTEASFRRSLRVVHVPAALFNASVASNSSFFVFHLARVAVRFYRALVQLLYEDPYERDVPVGFTDDSRAKLDALLGCFDGDVQSSLAAFSTAPTPEAVSQLRRAFLDSTSALLLAMKAFEELLPLRRIWNLDLRLAGLESSSARQLFFIYFALDNCQSTAPAFHRSLMSAEDRVNVPLKHIKQFAEAYHCKPQDPMASARHGSCSVMRRDRPEQPTQRWEYREPDRSSPSGVSRVHP
ncbi:serine/arginine repetitive matrix protein 2 [Dermacentor silvarum]|uniref:serine/arginine repetitive matrix protein 2 n=1 Tax=Dermacentor silvarum TaxID=543639 RepID=UPI00189C4DB6|nr:serine/arginine repetitive matrix protein 2 [Dermacentor silvarum]